MIREKTAVDRYVYVDVAAATRTANMKSRTSAPGENKPSNGYAISWSGQYEAMQRVKERLIVVVL